jgi:hypothetical protein
MNLLEVIIKLYYSLDIQILRIDKRLVGQEISAHIYGAQLKAES